MSIETKTETEKPAEVKPEPKTYSQEDVDKLVKNFEETSNKKIIEVYEKFLNASQNKPQAVQTTPPKKSWKF